ncbi:hypothetical protein Esti_003678 [Eimeria stiedai]
MHSGIDGIISVTRVLPPPQEAHGGYGQHHSPAEAAAAAKASLPPNSEQLSTSPPHKHVPPDARAGGAALAESTGGSQLFAGASATSSPDRPHNVVAPPDAQRVSVCASHLFEASLPLNPNERLRHPLPCPLPLTSAFWRAPLCSLCLLDSTWPRCRSNLAVKGFRVQGSGLKVEASALHAEARASLLGRVVAVDASMALYQFLTAVRDAQTMGNLTDEAGNVTSHLAGMLARVTRMLEQGIRPVYVFDGAAPEQKAAELEKRRERREEAEALAAAAKESGDREELRKQLARTIRVSPQQSQEVQQLLQLLGLPVVVAPGEAEAQCAELAKSGKVWAAATEDADALTFGTPILIRNLTFSDNSSSKAAAAAGPGSGGGSSASSPGSKSHPVLSIHLAEVLEKLKLSMDQFIDFCILCGCDYCGTIRGVGAKTAYSLIKQHGSIEEVVRNLEKDKYTVPDPFPFQAARECFKQPLVAPAADFSFKWSEVDEKGLKKFLVEDRSFNEARVDGYLARLRKARSLGSQTRLETFFGSAVSKASDLKQKQLKAAAEMKKGTSNNSNKKRKPGEAGKGGPPFKRR